MTNFTQDAAKPKQVTIAPSRAVLGLCEVEVNKLVVFVGSYPDCQIIADKHGPYQESSVPVREMWQWMQWR